MAARVAGAARRLVGELTGQEPAGAAAAAPLEVVAAARELSAAVADALQTAVDRARAAGHSWREIGDVLGTTRQAAFQRFGRPVDPRTGTPMSRRIAAGAEDRALEIVGCIAESRWEDARRDFDEQMLQVVSADRIAQAWAQTIGEVGEYERAGEPLAYQAGDFTMIDVPLYFEAGERSAQVALGPSGQVAGLRIRPVPM